MYKTNTIQCLGNSNKDFFFLKPTGQHSFMSQKKRGMTNVQTESSGEIRCHLAAFSHHALFLWGTGPDCPLWFGAFLRCSIFLLFFFFFYFFFSFIVLCCETVSPPGRSTHSVREKRLTFNSKTSSENINHVINEKCTSFNLFIYTFYTTVVITLGVFLLFLFFFKIFQSDFILEA